MSKRFKKIDKLREFIGYDEERDCENNQCLNQTIFSFLEFGNNGKAKISEDAKRLGIYYDYQEDEYICGNCMHERRNNHRKKPKSEECVCGGKMKNINGTWFCEFEGEKND